MCSSYHLTQPTQLSYVAGVQITTLIGVAEDSVDGTVAIIGLASLGLSDTKAMRVPFQGDRIEGVYRSFSHRESSVISLSKGWSASLQMSQL